ncbi:hypothetical protein [uncultured Gordonia sp.]|uniref:hypothetical protein n=1 Tax=uncultured Gordonia sp. TaxID=198437 RepID=UPI0025908E96|nr:hypothetical protein [uncultured Gordonia sp.]
MTAPNLEQIIADHAARYDEDLTDWLACSCGEWRIDSEQLDYSGDADRQADRAHAAHVVAAIRDSGNTVIALPKPHGRWAEGPEWVQGANLADRSGWVTWTAEGAGMVMLQRVEPGELTPADAADLGAALIAAAQHAGDTQ